MILPDTGMAVVTAVPDAEIARLKAEMEEASTVVLLGEVHEGMMKPAPLLRFFVPVLPQPQGNKTAYVRGGRAVLVEGRRPPARKAFQAYRQAVATIGQGVTARADGVWPRPGPLFMEAVYWFPRPKAHYGAQGRVKARFAATPKTTKPDRDKLDRAVLDALTGVVWVDDAQVVGGYTCKRFADRPAQVGVEIAVYEACYCGARGPCADCVAHAVLP